MKKFNNVIKKVDALKLIMIINVFMMIMIPYLSQRINNIILLLTIFNTNEGVLLWH